MRFYKRLLASVVVCIMLLFPVLSSAAITYTATLKRRGNVGDQAMVIAQLDLTGTYATGGFTLTPADFGLSTINQVIIPDYAGYSFAWDRANAKVLVYSSNADYTPSGTNATSAVTVTHSASPVTSSIVYMNQAGALFGTFSDAQNHTFTVPAQVFTGAASGAGAAEQVDNATSLAALNIIEMVVFGH